MYSPPNSLSTPIHKSEMFGFFDPTAILICSSHFKICLKELFFYRLLLLAVLGQLTFDVVV